MRVAFLFSHWACGAKPLDFNQLWTSDRALTGSDLGICMTAKEMAGLGHDVSLFTSHSTEQLPSPWEGVKLYHIRDAQGVINSNPFDAVISWSDPEPLQNLSDKPVRVVCQMLNDFSYCKPLFDNSVDLWTAPCQMLIDHLTKQSNSPPKEKFNVVPLGCDPELYSDMRVKGRVIWTSSPDRGLQNLLEIWPKIKQSVPFANLRIFYNFNYDSTIGFEPNQHNVHHHFLEMGNRARWQIEAIKRLKHLDVEHVGGINRERMIKEVNEASVFAFPCETISEITEGFSVSTLEAHAGYCSVIMSDEDCLGSIYNNSGAIIIKSPVRKRLQEFSDAVIKALVDKSFADGIINKCRVFAQNHTWKQSTQKIEQLIKSHPKYIK